MQDKRIQSEKKLISRMIHLYCKWGSGTNQICNTCEELIEYAYERLDRCPYGSHKPSCHYCHVSCFDSTMRLRMNQAMRYSLPKMFFIYPVAVIKHLWRDLRSKA